MVVAAETPTWLLFRPRTPKQRAFLIPKLKRHEKRRIQPIGLFQRKQF